jgi:hypothetical protein
MFASAEDLAAGGDALLGLIEDAEVEAASKLNHAVHDDQERLVRSDTDISHNA